MEFLGLRKEWDVAALAGEPRAVLGGIACDPRTGQLWALERRTARLLRVTPRTGDIAWFPVAEAPRQGDVAVDGSGTLYLWGGPGLTVRLFDTGSGVPAGAAEPEMHVVRVSACPGGGAAVFGEFVSPQGACGVAFWSAPGDERWRWLCPLDLAALVPICASREVLVVTESDRLAIQRLDAFGRLSGSETVCEVESQAGRFRSPDGKEAAPRTVALIDATQGPFPESALLLLNHRFTSGHYREVLLLHRPGRPTLAYDIIRTCLRIVMVGHDELAGCWNNMHTGECKIFLFSAPRWERGTPLEELG